MDDSGRGEARRLLDRDLRRGQRRTRAAASRSSSSACRRCARACRDRRVRWCGRNPRCSICTSRTCRAAAPRGCAAKLRTVVEPMPLAYAGYDDYRFGGAAVREGISHRRQRLISMTRTRRKRRRSPARSQVMPITLDDEGSARVTIGDLPATAECSSADGRAGIRRRERRVADGDRPRAPRARGVSASAFGPTAGWRAPTSCAFAWSCSISTASRARASR